MISANIQPTDQTSIADVYSEQLRSNSGARYHLVTTYSVIKSVSDVVLAKPKSPILRSQFPFRSKLLGLRSRCKTFAECTYFSPLNSWYRKYCRIQEKSYTESSIINETMHFKFNNMNREKAYLTMIEIKRLIRTNNLMKIRIHQFINNVNIIKSILLWRSYNILNSNNLWQNFNIRTL